MKTRFVNLMGERTTSKPHNSIMQAADTICSMQRSSSLTIQHEEQSAADVNQQWTSSGPFP